MSISGKEETGNFSWQSSNYSSGIPIKKRKYPLFRPPSPESQELPNISSVEAKISSPSRELSSSNVDTGASNASNSPVLNINEAITADAHVDLAGLNNQLNVVSQAQSLDIPLDSLHTKEKVFLSGQQNMIGGSKLDSAQVEVSPVLNINEAITADAHVDLAGLNNQLNVVSQAQSLDIPLDSLHTKEKVFLSGQQNMIGGSKLDSALVEVSPVLNINEAITADARVDLAGLNNQLNVVSQAQSLDIPLDSLHTKEKVFLSGQQNMIGGSKLDSAQVEVSVESTRKNLPGRDCTPELFENLGNTELSLGPEEPLVPASITDPDSKGGSQIPDKLDPSTLCLSLSQNNSASGYEVKDSMVNSASTCVHAKRSNWDLNTSMDAWEGPAGDCDSLITVMNPCLMHDMEPIISAVPKFVSEAEEQFFGVTRRVSDSPTSSHVDKYRSDDSLQLSLSTSAPTVFSVKQSNVSAQVNSGIFLPNSELVEGLVSTSSAGCDTVKSEPFDETGKHRNLGVRGISVKLLDQVNKGLMEKSIIKAVNSPNVSLKNVTEPILIKSEPVQEGKEMQLISHASVEKGIPCQENVSLSLTTSRQLNESSPLGLFTCSKLTVNEDVPNQSEITAHMEEAHEGKDNSQLSGRLVDQAATGIFFPSLGLDSKESTTFDGMIYTGSTVDVNVDKPEKSKLEAEDVFKSTNKNSDGFESDEENKNILNDILEEDAYGSDSGSEGNHEALVNLKSKHVGKEDEYEDGEVREALMHAEADVAKDNMEKEMMNQDAYECTNAPSPDINDRKFEEHGKISDSHVEEIAGVLQKATDEVTDRDCSLQETTIEETANRDDEKRPIKTTGRSPPVLSGGTDDREGHDRDELSDGATGGSRDNGITVSQIATVGSEGTDTFEKVDPTLPNTELNFSDKNSGKDTNNADADRDGNSGGSRSRIINLSRASTMTSPCEPRFMFSRPLSATERDRHTDIEEDRIPLRRNRAEYYSNVPQNFDNDRFHDRSFRNSGTNFVRGRGRGRCFRQHIEWDSDRNFGADINYNSGSYRFSRYKCAGVNDAEFEGNGYGIATSRSSGIGRGGNSSRHPYSRRLSPGATDGTGTRGTQLLQRFPGNANSSRSIGEHNPDSVGPRNGGKFLRGLRKDVDDTTFDHPRHVNEGVDEQFVGGSRNFSTSLQRRGPRRIRSKSPVSSRTRSPGQWPSPRRRSSDNLIGLEELNHRRSPTTYRMDRIRSPDRPCFSEEAMGRRGGSPPYVARPSNDLRNMESGSANPNRRRPYDRVLPEGTSRRLNITDPRERRDDEFFRGPNYSGRYNEFGGQGRGDDRRKYGERRGRGRSFRPSFNGADGGTFRFNENGNRPFCPEADSKHIERGDLREREFDRRINYKTGVSPSRTRNLEEGGNRRGEQVWHDDGFDDVPEMKRRKF